MKIRFTSLRLFVKCWIFSRKIWGFEDRSSNGSYLIAFELNGMNVETSLLSYRGPFSVWTALQSVHLAWENSHSCGIYNLAYIYLYRSTITGHMHQSRVPGNAVRFQNKTVNSEINIETIVDAHSDVCVWRAHLISDFFPDTARIRCDFTYSDPVQWLSIIPSANPVTSKDRARSHSISILKSEWQMKCHLSVTIRTVKIKCSWCSVRCLLTFNRLTHIEPKTNLNKLKACDLLLIWCQLYFQRKFELVTSELTFELRSKHRITNNISMQVSDCISLSHTR